MIVILSRKIYCHCNVNTYEQILYASLAHYNFYANGILLETAAKIPYEILVSTFNPSRHSVLTLLIAN